MSMVLSGNERGCRFLGKKMERARQERRVDEWYIVTCERQYGPHGCKQSVRSFQPIASWIIPYRHLVGLSQSWNSRTLNSNSSYSHVGCCALPSNCWLMLLLVLDGCWMRRALIVAGFLATPTYFKLPPMEYGDFEMKRLHWWCWKRVVTLQDCHVKHLSCYNHT